MPAGTSDAQSEAPAAARPVVDLEERGWLTRHCRGDETAFAALLAAYRRPLYGYLVRSGVREAERDDLFQSIVLKIHQAAARYQPARPLAPWLFTIAANTVRNHFRDSPDASLVSADEDLAEALDPVPGPERVLEARETVAWLEAEMAALPAMQRQVLVLVTIAGLAQRDVAEALELPLNTVKTHLRRARLGLARAMLRREAAAEASGGDHEHL